MLGIGGWQFWKWGSVGGTNNRCPRNRIRHRIDFTYLLMIIQQLRDLSTTVAKLLIYFNINHVNDAPVPSLSHPSLRSTTRLGSGWSFGRGEGAVEGRNGERETRRFDQDRLLQLLMLVSGALRTVFRVTDEFTWASALWLAQAFEIFELEFLTHLKHKNTQFYVNWAVAAFQVDFYRNYRTIYHVLIR